MNSVIVVDSGPADRVRSNDALRPFSAPRGDGIDRRVRMYGAPTGYEFVGLVEAIIVAGTGKIDLDPETMKWIQAVNKPTHIQVFSTPT